MLKPMHAGFYCSLGGYEVLVPSDCVASGAREDNDYALAQMRKVLGADTRSSPRLTLC